MIFFKHLHLNIIYIVIKILYQTSFIFIEKWWGDGLIWGGWGGLSPAISDCIYEASLLTYFSNVRCHVGMLKLIINIIFESL